MKESVLSKRPNLIADRVGSFWVDANKSIVNNFRTNINNSVETFEEDARITPYVCWRILDIKA